MQTGEIALQPVQDEALKQTQLTTMKRRATGLLVLAGATMDLSAPSTLWRWPGGAKSELPSLVRGDELHPALQLPHERARRDDHPEAVALFPGGARASVMVLYDAASEGRLVPGGVLADVFELDERA